MIHPKHGCGFESRCTGGLRTVFIATVAHQRYEIARSREHRLDHAKIINVELDAEYPDIVGEVLRHTEPSADDYASHRRTIQYVTNPDIGDTYPVSVGDLLQHREQLLEQRPVPPSVEHVFVFLQRGGVQFGSTRLWAT